MALYALDGFERCVPHLADSSIDKRSWCVVHADSGQVILCLWYRRADVGIVDSVRRFHGELSVHIHHAVSCIIIGDLTIHNVSWLQFSKRDTPEGDELEAVWCENCLKQLVTKPPRGPYVLDLVLSDLASGIRCKVVPGTRGNDLESLLATVQIKIFAAHPVGRAVYDFKKADCPQPRLCLLETDWRSILALSGDEATDAMVQRILDAVALTIPFRVVNAKVLAHPWLNDSCVRALQRKRKAFGSPTFELRRDECSQVFLEAYYRYVAKTREDPKKRPPTSRRWWELSSSLLQRGVARERILPLKREDVFWALSPAERASELAWVFSIEIIIAEQHRKRAYGARAYNKSKDAQSPSAFGRHYVCPSHCPRRHVGHRSGSAPNTCAQSVRC